MLTQNKKQFKARMKKSLSILVLCFLVSSIVLTMIIAQPWQVRPANAAVITFPDANLEAAVRDAIAKPTGDIYDTDVNGLTTFDASGRSISNITGMEYFTSLTSLHLGSNQISDISPLSALTSLTQIDLWSNQISNLSSLSGLTSLTSLELSYNQISNLALLSSLTLLPYLRLYGNQISDITPLSSLTSLTVLELGSNQISNLTGLSTLTSLTNLGLGFNEISDISPLSTLTSLTWLDLQTNSISDISALSSLTNLTWLNLSYSSVSDISALSGLINLSNLNLGMSLVSDISPLANLISLNEFWLFYTLVSDISALENLLALTFAYLDSNQISDISPLLNLTNLNGLYLRSNLIDIDPTSPTSQKNILETIDGWATHVIYENQYEAFCSDGYDNDQDGDIDTADSNCELPSTLKTNGSVSPVNVVTTNPDFTAQYNDFLGSSQYAQSYQIQVIENGGDFSSPLWDSGQVDLDSYPPGLAEESVSEDIPYGGSALALDGTQYNWRVRFYSAIGSISAWSDGTSSFTMQDIPTDPSGCSASRVSDVEFNVSWSDNSTYEDGFVVQRNTNSSGSYAGWQTIGTVSSNTTSFVDNSTNNPADPPQTDEKYQYRVYAYNTAGNSGYSTDAIEHYTTPDAPTEVAGNYVSDSQFSIGYTDNAGAEDTHHFNRCTGANCDSATYETDLSTTESSPMTDSSGLSIDEKYRWQARSETPTLLYSSYGYSNYEYTTPSAPSDVVATYVSDNEIGLTWADNSTYEDGFRIEVSTDAGAYEEISPGVNTVGAGITTYNFTGADTNHK
ncbi:MAG: leucine-rich repeat domain-containing protein, partial [Patescibacteria group bacterium]|nr:leucine-rich repeat domain-containing protein [Patescibacteria group bacterium]